MIQPKLTTRREIERKLYMKAIDSRKNNRVDCLAEELIGQIHSDTISTRAEAYQRGLLYLKRLEEL